MKGRATHTSRLIVLRRKKPPPLAVCGAAVVVSASISLTPTAVPLVVLGMVPSPVRRLRPSSASAST
jgi:hypothetical protein